MGIPIIGQLVRLQKLVVDEEQGSRIYKTRIADLKFGDYIALELPIDEQSGQVGLFLPRTELSVWYISADGSELQFYTYVIGRSDENIPLILIQYPDKDKINRNQKRNFLRVQTKVSIAVKLQADEDRPYHFITETIDISAGGMCFVSPNTYTFEKGDQVQIWMVFSTRSTGVNRVFVTGEVVRIEAPEGSRKHNWISIKFLTMREVDHQKIIRFCFDKQFELREKGLV